MSNKREISRRQFLRGLAGSTLYLPMLPSLMSKKALAAATSAPAQLRFMSIMSSHGSLQFPNWFPASDPTQSLDLYPGHAVRWGNLTSHVTNGRLSPVLGADFTPYLNKINLVRGLDVLQYLGHHLCTLGNFYANINGSKEGMTPMPTIDQIMAYSTKFYASSPTGPRSLVMGGGGFSYNYSNPQRKDASTVTRVSAFGDPVSAYNAVFGVVSAGGSSTSLSKKITNDVFQDYQRLAQSSRIGHEDRDTLEGHMSMLSELEKRLQNYSASCSAQAPTQTGSYDDGSRYLLYNDVIAAAFKCNMTRIASVLMEQGLGVGSGGTWHAWAHSSDLADSQQHLVEMNGFGGEKIFLDLVKKLDVVEDPTSGKTYLDNSLIMWLQEHSITHSCVSLPLITAGSAGGRLNTGRYIDYRNLAKAYDATKTEFEGVLYNRYLVTVMQAMGLSQPDYQINHMPGYGDTVNNSYAGFKNSRIGRYSYELARLNTPLELLWKG
jgi:hypothetical protein